MKDKRIYPQNYLEQIEYYFKQKLPAQGPYSTFYINYFKIDKKHADDRKYPLDIATNAFNYHQSNRYGNIYTARQTDFPTYPAAKIQTGEKKEIFDVLAEGPLPSNLQNLLQELNDLNVQILIPVGKPYENREKFHNYMNDEEATEINLGAFFQNTSNLTDLPQELAEQTNKTNFKFYCYTYGKDNFYILHIPNWNDHDMPALNTADKIVLGYYFEFGKNACYHCSAGIGRSVSIMMVKMFYQNIFKSRGKDNIAIKDLEDYFVEAFTKIKEVKPGAGEVYQLLTVPGIAEDVYDLVGCKLEKILTNNNNNIEGQSEIKTTPVQSIQNTSSYDKHTSNYDPRTIGKIPASGPDKKSDDNEKTSLLNKQKKSICCVMI